MNSRRFEDEKGRLWIVSKVGSTLAFYGEREENETYCENARSGAYRLGITQSKYGNPLKYVNEHRRIWNRIWDKGKA